MEYGRDRKAFLELLRCGIWGKCPDPSCFAGLDPERWRDIYGMAGRQAVLGICLQPVLDLPDGLQPPAALLMQWVGLNRFIEARNIRIREVWRELEDRFGKEGIRPVVFKGMSHARWYARPLSRQCSDLDIYVPEKFAEAVRLVRSWGPDPVHRPQHDTFVYGEVEVEMHPRLFHLPRRLAGRCAFADAILADGTVIRTLEPDMLGLVLLSHAARHFLGGSIGYRFLCDWAVFLQHNHGRLDRRRMLDEARRMGMSHFVAEFTRLAQLQLGLDIPGLEEWTAGSKEKYTARLSQRLFEGGDFGARNFHRPENPRMLARVAAILGRWWTARYYWPLLFWKKAPRFLFRGVVRTLARPFRRKG